jgi:hypothetical protein
VPPAVTDHEVHDQRHHVRAPAVARVTVAPTRCTGCAHRQRDVWCTPPKRLAEAESWPSPRVCSAPGSSSGRPLGARSRHARHGRSRAMAWPQSDRLLPADAACPGRQCLRSGVNPLPARPGEQGRRLGFPGIDEGHIGLLDTALDQRPQRRGDPGDGPDHHPDVEL